MPFIELQSVDSTNNYARSLIQEGLAEEGTAVFAHEQWAGKGQRGNKWLSEKGSNIILSILARPAKLRIDQQFDISFCTAVTLLHFFERFTKGNCSIKWPNDLYWRDRKAGGILIENVIRGESGSACWEWMIIGIGVNINQVNFPAGIRNPVSLRHVTGQVLDPLLLAKDLHEAWKKNFEILVREGPSYFFGEYQARLYKKDQAAKFKTDNRVFEGTIKGVTKEGKLIVGHSIPEFFSVGEIEMI